MSWIDHHHNVVAGHQSGCLCLSLSLSFSPPLLPSHSLVLRLSRSLALLSALRSRQTNCRDMITAVMSQTVRLMQFMSQLPLCRWHWYWRPTRQRGISLSNLPLVFSYLFISPALFSSSSPSSLPILFLFSVSNVFILSSSVTQHLELPASKRGTLVWMSEFCSIDNKPLEQTPQNLNSSTCCLDTLPTNFFKSVFHLMAADVLKIVNALLLSGTFPESLKTACYKAPTQRE